MEGLLNEVSELSKLSSARGKRGIAIDELLRWVYRDQKADLVVDSGAGLYPLEAACDGVEIRRSTTDGCGSTTALLGVRVDVIGRSNGALHTDALTVHMAMKRLGHMQSSLLIDYAKVGDRPDWMPGATVKLGPKINRIGNPQMIYLTRNEPVACEITETITQAYIDYMRGVFVLWYDGLEALLQLLDTGDEMIAFKPIMIATARRPWA